MTAAGQGAGPAAAGGRRPDQVVAALSEAGLQLPAVTPPLAAYVPAVRAGGLIHVSGQLPVSDGSIVVGSLGDGALTVADGQAAAALCALGAIAAALTQVAEDEIVRVVKVNAFIASEPGFAELPEVANGASEVLGTAFGLPHARSAIGVSGLPRGAAVEVDAVFAVSRAGG